MDFNLVVDAGAQLFCKLMSYPILCGQAMAIYKASSSIPTAPTCSIDAGTAESEADCIEPDQPAKHPSSSSSF